MLYAILLMQIFVGQSESSENTVEKLSLAEKLFPAAELVWSKTFEGKMTDFAIAEKSGHIVIGAVKDLKGWVYLFSPDGKLLWTKENDKHSKIKECAGVGVAISDNGETTVVQWGGDYEEVQVYDITGEKLYTHKHGMSTVAVAVSPGGGYIKHARLFDKTGKKIVLGDILKGLPIEKLRHRIEYKNGTYSPYIYRDINFTFVSEKEIAVLLDSVLYFYSFPEGKLKWKSKELDGDGKITVEGRYILVSGDREVYLYDKEGRLIWEKRLDKKLYSHAVAFSRDKKNIGIYGLPGKRRVILFDLTTGKIEVSTHELESKVSLPKLLLLANKVLLSGYTGGQTSDEMKGYCTYIMNFDDNWNIVSESWEKGLIFGTSTSPLIGVYESDATGETESGYDEGVFGYENSTVFTINILKIRD